MACSSRVAIVTGANKGIGFEIVKQLIPKFNGSVYLTSRDETRGEKAIEELKKEGLTAHYHQLDVTDNDSCQRFVQYIKERYNRIDVLVSNAGIAYEHDEVTPFGEAAESTFATNYFGLARFSDLAFPLLQKHARVVNLSSSVGHLSWLKGTSEAANALREKLANPLIKREELDALAAEFVTKAKEGTHQEAGWPNSSYCASKILVSVLTRIQQREVDEQRKGDDIVINAAHPGYVDTDLTCHKGPFTPARGAQSSLFAALLPEGVENPRGGFIWNDNAIVDFTAAATPSLH